MCLVNCFVKARKEPRATTTTTTSSTTTTTLCTNVPTGTVVKGSLTASPGRFTYNATLGLNGANAACTANFPGSHPCTVSNLQSAPTTDLACLTDTASIAVTTFWAIDPAADPVTAQCFDDVLFNPMTQPGHNWEYATAHTISRGQKLPLNNFNGTLGALQTGLQCNGSTAWVGCCQ